MNLNKRLAEIRHAFETGDTPREIVKVLNDNIEKLLAANVSSNALKVGDQAPLDVTVQSIDGPKSLRYFLRKRFLVVTWFRGNW